MTEFKSSNKQRNMIFWLASYPKSGNTWFRVFLTCLLSGDPKKVDINKLEHGQYPNNRLNFDELNGFSSSNLSAAEMNQIRPTGLHWISQNTNKKLFFKTHSAFDYNQDQTPVLGSQKTGIAGALYFVRNPLDVCISYAHYNDSSIDATIKLMADNKHMVHVENTRAFIPEKISSWSQNVNGWVSAPEISTMVIRYEDMLNQPIATFRRACEFLQLGAADHAIQQAIEACHFEQLQRQERNGRFIEKSEMSSHFFRKGIAGDWLTVLSKSQVDQVINDHADMMQRFGYLDQAGNPKVS